MSKVKKYFNGMLEIVNLRADLAGITNHPTSTGTNREIMLVVHLN